jgi:hypothetical protein
MSKRAGKIGSDVREALRVGAAWTPMIGVIIRKTLYVKSHKPERRKAGERR